MQGRKLNNDDLEVWEIDSWEECLYSDDLLGQLRSHFKSWGVHHTDNPQELSQEELAAVVNDLVFSNWDSFQKFHAPEFKHPDIRDMYVRVGVFSKDLPDPKKGQSMLAGTLGDELFAFLAEDEQYSAPAERKAGQPAYLRTSVDESGKTIIYDWMDVNGKWAPYSAIRFDSNHDMPYNWTFGLAYRRHGIAWARACDEWNSRLCVYLCRRDIWAATNDQFFHSGSPSAIYIARNESFWDPGEEIEKEYTPAHFVKAPSIRDT
ncbi:hypothetical protein LQW54_007247 [Pestalotiopsis sp. IQ-011]